MNTFLLLSASLTAGADPAAAEFFEKSVRPVLVEHCQRCHGEKKQKCGVRLDAAGELDPAEVGRHLLALNERVNREDDPALAELEALLDRHPPVWQTSDELTADTAAWWAQLLGHGQPVESACLRRQTRAWVAGLAGGGPPPPPPPPLPPRRSKRRRWRGWRPSSPRRSCSPPPAAKRAAALTRLTAANRQLLDALKLVATATTASDTRVEQHSAERPHRVASRRFGEAG